jgi:hypothetical protein
MRARQEGGRFYSFTFPKNYKMLETMLAAAKLRNENMLVQFGLSRGLAISSSTAAGIAEPSSKKQKYLAATCKNRI